MTLAVCGKQSLSEMEKYVKEAFSAVPNVKQVDPAAGWWGKVPPFAPQSAATAVEVVPIADSQSLTLSWPIWIRSAEEREALKIGKPDYALTHLIGNLNSQFRFSFRSAPDLLVVATYCSYAYTVSFQYIYKIVDKICSGHEGEGSLRSALVKRGWINSIQAYTGTDVSDCQKFDVHIELTDTGLQHRHDVAAAVFAYLDLLKQQYQGTSGDSIGGGVSVTNAEKGSDKVSSLPGGGVPSSSQQQESAGLPQYLLDELRRLSHIAFDYAEKSDPTHYTSSVVTNMQHYPPAQYLTGPQLFDAPDQAQIATYLAHLTPSAAQLMYVSPSYKNKTSLVANYYGTEYNNITLFEETKRWNKVKASDFPELTLPRPNILLPENFNLLSADDKIKLILSEEEKKARLMTPPALVLKDEKWEVWHKLDRSFRQPKVYVVISLAVPTSVHSPEFVVNSKLFSACFQDKINEFLYEARLAGLGLEFEFTSRGAQLTLSGFNDKMPLFAQKVCAALRSFTADQATYDRHKEQLQRELNSWTVQQPYYHAAYFATLASETLQYSVPELVAALDKASIRQLDGYLQQILPKSYGKALVAGNADAVGAQRLVDIVRETFPFSSLPASQRSQREVAVIPVAGASPATSSSTVAGSAGAALSVSEGNIAPTVPVPAGLRLSNVEPNLNDDNSAATFYFQLPSRAPADYMFVELLNEVLEQPFYNSLRTQQQLGYIVYSGVKVREGVKYLTFVVQSSTVSGEDISQKIEEFLRDKVPEILTNLTENDLRVFKEGISVRKLEPDQRLTAQAGRFWSEIVTRTATTARKNEDEGSDPLFNRAHVEVDALDAIRLPQFTAFTKEFLLLGGAQRRLLISQVSSAGGAKKTAAVGEVSGVAGVAGADQQHQAAVSLAVDGSSVTAAPAVPVASVTYNYKEVGDSIAEYLRTSNKM